MRVERVEVLEARGRIESIFVVLVKNESNKKSDRTKPPRTRGLVFPFILCMYRWRTGCVCVCFLVLMSIRTICCMVVYRYMVLLFSYSLRLIEGNNKSPLLAFCDWLPTVSRSHTTHTNTNQSPQPSALFPSRCGASPRSRPTANPHQPQPTNQSINQSIHHGTPAAPAATFRARGNTRRTNR